MYEWDEAKRQANFAKHGVDFATAEGFDWDTALVMPDLRRDFGEPRFVAFGFIDRRLRSLIFTPRGGKARIISLRKANPREIRHHEQTQEA